MSATAQAGSQGVRGGRPLCALVVDDEPSVRGALSTIIEAGGWVVGQAETLGRARELLAQQQWSLIFLDKVLPDGNGVKLLEDIREQNPDTFVVILTGQGSAEEAIFAMTAGALDYVAKPVEVRKVRAIQRRCEALVGRDARRIIPVGNPDARVVAKSPAMIAIYVQLTRVARTDLPVFITGATGTGKEVLARELHHLGDPTKPFVSINCSAIPKDLIESELFGHARGAFTGAERERMGLLEEANGGTIFLDEITETTPQFQVKLLRALQDKKVRRVGSNTIIDLNVRVISATNRNIHDEVASGRFRQDLFYRLKGCLIELPLLKDRPEDILPLVEHFTSRIARPVEFTESAVEALMRYSWPGNVRELELAVNYAVKTCDGVVQLSDLPPEIQLATGQEEPATAGVVIGTAEEFVPLNELVQMYIERVLESTGGNKAEASRKLGVPYSTLKRLIGKARRGGLLTDRPGVDVLFDEPAMRAAFDNFFASVKGGEDVGLIGPGTPPDKASVEE